jgi:hypothetical protein
MHYTHGRNHWRLLQGRKTKIKIKKFWLGNCWSPSFFFFSFHGKTLRKGISRRQTQLISFVKSFSDTIVVFSPERTRVEREGGIRATAAKSRSPPIFGGAGLRVCVFIWIANAHGAQGAAAAPTHRTTNASCSFFLLLRTLVGVKVFFIGEWEKKKLPFLSCLSTTVSKCKVSPSLL